jgi:hypothetical protein
MGSILIAVGVIALMIVGCYILSGSDLIAGSIFEKKTPVGKK